MKQLQKATLDLKPTPHSDFDFFDYYLLKQSSQPGASIGSIKFAKSVMSQLSQKRLNTTCLMIGKPPVGWYSIIIKPCDQPGIGPLNRVDRDTVVHILPAKEPVWSIGTTGNCYYTLAIQSSLLAKHALGLVDTSILNVAASYRISASISTRLLNRLEEITENATSPNELDVRLSHLLLAICEAIAEQPHLGLPTRQEIATHQAIEDIYHQARNKPDKKVDALLKAHINMNLNQLESAYKLNLVRRDLFLSNRSFAECVNFYEFQNADQLYRFYIRLFAEQPPIPLKNPHNPVLLPPHTSRHTQAGHQHKA